MKYVVHPKEYFLAQILFALKISQIKNIDFPRAMLDYTDLYHSLTNKSYGDKEEQGMFHDLWNCFTDELNAISTHGSKNKGNSQNQIPTLNPEPVTDVIYSLYIQQPHSIYDPKTLYPGNHFTFRSGCFAIDYGPYNQARKQIRLHFTPTRKGLEATEASLRRSDLATVYMHERRSVFQGIFEHIRNNPEKFPGAKSFLSSTWLNNIPNYTSLFPAEAVAKKKLVTDSFLGWWGQFERWDFTPNLETLNSFVGRLGSAKTFEEVVAAIPNQVYRIEFPLSANL